MKPTRRAFVRPNGLAYRTHTSPGADGTPVFVLLHGIGMSHRYLDKLHDTLASFGTVISFDLPGFGGTPKPARPVTVEQYAELVAHALRRASVTECVVVGHSMGCQFAIELARQHPSLVSHTVLIGAVVDARRRTVWRQAAALSADFLVESPHTNAIVVTDYLRCGIRWYLAELEKMMDYPTERRVEDLTCPVLVVRGARDPVAGRVWTAILAARAPRGRMLEIAGGGHVVQQSVPGEVATAIRSFTVDPLSVGRAP
jgi:pimeloyl-ACP methyl ester carboxylesterase